MSAVGSTRGGSTLLSALLATSAFATIMSAGVAQAQTAPAATPDTSVVTEIVVTGTRIRSTGFSAPTPTQVLGEADIERAAQPNIFTAITQLPSLQGSTGATTGTFSTSSGSQGLSSFSLRGLGTIRTLTLLDGQRVVPANVTGVPDISLFPQLLVQQGRRRHRRRLGLLRLGRGRRRGQLHHQQDVRRLQGQYHGRRHDLWR
jgi:iron complex outermembrane receptor protein